MVVRGLSGNLERSDSQLEVMTEERFYLYEVARECPVGIDVLVWVC